MPHIFSTNFWECSRCGYTADTESKICPVDLVGVMILSDKKGTRTILTETDIDNSVQVEGSPVNKIEIDNFISELKDRDMDVPVTRELSQKERKDLKTKIRLEVDEMMKLEKG